MDDKCHYVILEPRMLEVPSDQTLDMVIDAYGDTEGLQEVGRLESDGISTCVYDLAKPYVDAFLPLRRALRSS